MSKVSTLILILISSISMLKAINAGEDRNITLGEYATLNATDISSNTNIIWSIDDDIYSNDSIFYFSPESTGTYNIHLTSSDGTDDYVKVNVVSTNEEDTNDKNNSEENSNGNTNEDNITINGEKVIILGELATFSTTYQSEAGLSWKIKVGGAWDTFAYGNIFYFIPEEEKSYEISLNDGDRIIATKIVTSSTKIGNCDMTTAITREELFRMINNNEDVTSVNTCRIKDMSWLFKNNRTFNQDISSWNTSNVTNMDYMFFRTKKFNQNINSWDVSNVKSMKFIFGITSDFNQPLDNWNISNLINMNDMFFYAKSFNQPLNNWDVSNVKYMQSVFIGTESFNQPLDNWDVSNVINMNSMFYGAVKFNQPLNRWNVSNNKNMHRMFGLTSNFNQPLNNWDVSKVTDMTAMFRHAKSFNQNLDDWNTSSLLGSREMFFKSNMEKIPNWYNPYLGKPLWR